MSCHLFAHEALALIPQILTLQDRNPHSPTYGCFDRNYWHYKIIDFPSGMAQEFVWPLALAYTLAIPGNPFFQIPAIKEWVEAGIHFAARAARADGSCDGYFPFEKSAGAAAFSLLACMESYTLLELHDPEMLDFFGRRADWLADHRESGRLTSHQALIVLCLEKAGRLFASPHWDKAKARRLKRVLEWQNDEGWFHEYEGCDPGYHTLTIALLAQLYALTPTTELKTALQKAIHFAAHFVHPDGSFGGEYTSRNTYNFFPHGFEIAGQWMPEALEINDRFLTGLARGLGACYADDHILGHHAWSYLLAWQHFIDERPAPTGRPAGRLHFQKAGLLIERRGDATLYLALNKGGVFKLFRGDELAYSDTHFSLQVASGRKTRTAVGHLVGKYDLEMEADAITLRGKLGWAKNQPMTTFQLVMLRALMFTVGRYFPNLIRKRLQKRLITGKKTAPFPFVRTFAWEEGGLRVSDEIYSRTWRQVKAAGIGAAQTSIHVVMSRTYQPGQLQPWYDLTDQLVEAEKDGYLRLERVL